MFDTKRIRVRHLTEPVEISSIIWCEMEPIDIDLNMHVSDIAKKVRSTMRRGVIVIRDVYRIVVRCNDLIEQVTAYINYKDESVDKYAAAITSAFICYKFGLSTSVMMNVFDICMKSLEEEDKSNA